jgi:hydroxymethylpyrimidine/phosphomethylpyrimidine kinase
MVSSNSDSKTAIGHRGNPTLPPPVALTIAGSDSGGGAGIQADLKTFQAFGVFGASAITAVTAQNTSGVYGIRTIEPELVARQIEVVVEDLDPAAAKTGMLADAAIVEVVISAVRAAGLARLVVDPVMVATSGDRLLEKNAEKAYRRLYPLATLLTPNLREAELLSGRPIGDLKQMCEAARAIVDDGCRAVLIKGGHLPGEVVLDLMHDGERWHLWESERLGTGGAHGTGCTLSAAITAGLALGQRLFPAVDRALRYTREALRRAPALGRGHRPLDHWASVDRALPPDRRE